MDKKMEEYYSPKTLVHYASEVVGKPTLAVQARVENVRLLMKIFGFSRVAVVYSRWDFHNPVLQVLTSLLTGKDAKQTIPYYYWLVKTKNGFRVFSPEEFRKKYILGQQLLLSEVEKVVKEGV